MFISFSLKIGSKNDSAKKMSLEEFLGDDSLGDSVWNEDDINLDAINNTINIEVLKNSHPKSNINNNSTLGGQPQIRQNMVLPQYSVKSTTLSSSVTNSTSVSSSSFNQNDYYKKQNPQLKNVSDSHSNNQQQFVVQGPPYMIKFSNLPPRFANSDIEELFEAKYTKFVKFKIFWEINKNPSLSTLKSGSIFDQNFKRDSKVAFVEVYSARDIMKILKYWCQPLKEIYKIRTEPAQYDDFKEYMAKINLLTDPSDDPSKSYVVPMDKPSPFGIAKSVDTQSKILNLEEKMERLHIENTETLRRRSSEGEPLESLKSKITVLKKPQLSYSEVAQHSLLDSVKKNSPQVTGSGIVTDSSSNSQATSNPSNNEFKSESVPNNHDTNQENEDKENSTGYNDNITTPETYENYDMSEDGTKTKPDENIEEETSKIFTFKNQERDMSPSNNNNNNVQNYNRSYRGGRGSSFRGRGGRGGNFSRGSSSRGRGGYTQRFTNSSDNSRNTSYRKQTFEGKDDSPSLFAPASGFLQTTTKNDRGGHNNNSRGRGGYYRGHSNYRGSYI